MRIFEIEDRSGRIVYLSKERWIHMASEHPAVANKIEDVKDVVLNPLIIKESEYDPNVRYYYKYYKNIKLSAKYLLVAVKYINGEGYIITSFYTSRIKGK